MTPACQNAVNTEPNPEEPAQPLTYTMKSTTFLCALPNCVYQDFEPLAVSPAFPPKPSPEPDLFPASSNLWEPLAVSGSGTTWGTSEDGVLPDYEYVPTNATISICAAIQDPYQLFRAGFVDGVWGPQGTYSPYWFPLFSDGIYAIFDNNVPADPGDNMSSRMVNVTTAPEGEIYDYTLGYYVATFTFQDYENETPRTNESFTAISTNPTVTVNNNSGYWLHGYYQPANTETLNSWGAYLVESASPYTVAKLNGTNWFATPILN